MKSMEDQTYYEILEVSPAATSKEIQKAYERARETFDTESVAVYSLFSEKEIRELQGLIEEAYRVLTDEGLRRSYDQAHLSPSDLIRPKDLPEPEEIASPKLEIQSSLASPPEPVVGEVAFVYRGATLKQIREKMGMDLKTLSNYTKISPRVLQWIEEETLDKLPPVVYLKGFLRSYSQSLGLDSKKVIEGYLQFLLDNEKQ